MIEKPKAHGYQIPNMLPAIYPVYHDVQISSIVPGEHDKMVDLTVEFREPAEMKVYHVDFIKDLTQKLEISNKLYITLALTPRSAYVASGSSSIGWITVTDTNIPFNSGFSPDQWMPEITTSLALTIKGRVGVHLEGSDHDKAVEIMRYIREKLIDNLGTPSDAISQLPPLEQFDAAVKGEGRLQCNNLVDIFVQFCAAYGIIARRINLWQGGVWPAEKAQELGYNLLTAGGHTTAEIFDCDLNQWVWMDPMYGIEYGFLMNNADPPLTLYELQSYLLHPREEDSVCISQYKSTKKEGFTSDIFEDLPEYSIWGNYLSEQQRITYICPRRLD